MNVRSFALKLFGFTKPQGQSPRIFTNDHKQDALVKQGREQFKRLLEKGLSIPVVLL